MPRTSNLINGLPLRKQRYAKLLAEGTMTKGEALLAAGYSKSVSNSPSLVETDDFKAAFQQIIRRKIKPNLIAKRVKEGIDAIETQFFTKDGIVTDSRDTVNYSERRQYATLAAQFGGYWNPKQEVVNTQKIDESTMSRLIDLADKLDLVDEQVLAANSLYERSVNGNGPVIEADASDGYVDSKKDVIE